MSIVKPMGAPLSALPIALYQQNATTINRYGRWFLVAWLAAMADSKIFSRDRHQHSDLSISRIGRSPTLGKAGALVSAGLHAAVAAGSVASTGEHFSLRHYLWLCGCLVATGGQLGRHHVAGLGGRQSPVLLTRGESAIGSDAQQSSADPLSRTPPQPPPPIAWGRCGTTCPPLTR